MRAERQRHVAFRGAVAEVVNELTQGEAEFIAVTYEETRRFKKPLDLADMLMQRDCIQNTVSDLNLFGKILARAKRKDLQKKVDAYVQNNKLPHDVPEHRPSALQPIQPLAFATVTSTNNLVRDEENYDSKKSKVIANER